MIDEIIEDASVVTPEEGWHVNTRGEMPEAVVPFEIHPVQPRRICACPI